MSREQTPEIRTGQESTPEGNKEPERGIKLTAEELEAYWQLAQRFRGRFLPYLELTDPHEYFLEQEEESRKSGVLTSIQKHEGDWSHYLAQGEEIESLTHDKNLEMIHIKATPLNKEIFFIWPSPKNEQEQKKWEGLLEGCISPDEIAWLPAKPPQLLDQLEKWRFGSEEDQRLAQEEEQKVIFDLLARYDKLSSLPEIERFLEKNPPLLWSGRSKEISGKKKKEKNRKSNMKI